MDASACVPLYSRRQQHALGFLLGHGVRDDMSTGIREASFMWYVWSVILPDRDVGCTTVKEDTKGAIHLANNPVAVPNSKHTDVRHHLRQDRVASGEFKNGHIPSEEQHAIFLTKESPRKRFCFAVPL